jgi:hypothetical protein
MAMTQKEYGNGERIDMAGQLPAVKPLLRSPKGNRICPFYPFFEGGFRRLPASKVMVP